MAARASSFVRRPTCGTCTLSVGVFSLKCAQWRGMRYACDVSRCVFSCDLVFDRSPGRPASSCSTRGRRSSPSSRRASWSLVVSHQRASLLLRGITCVEWWSLASRGGHLRREAVTCVSSAAARKRSPRGSRSKRALSSVEPHRAQSTSPHHHLQVSPDERRHAEDTRVFSEIAPSVLASRGLGGVSSDLCFPSSASSRLRREAQRGHKPELCR